MNLWVLLILSALVIWTGAGVWHKYFNYKNIQKYAFILPTDIDHAWKHFINALAWCIIFFAILMTYIYIKCS